LICAKFGGKNGDLPLPMREGISLPQVPRFPKSRQPQPSQKRMADGLSLAQQVLAAQPFSALLGAEITQFGNGQAELRIAVTDKLRQQQGFVHGGVLSYAADNALTFAGGSVLGPAVVTAEFKINYVRPALGELLIAKAMVVYAGKRQAVCRCEVINISEGHESLCALAQGTISALSQDHDGMA